MPEPIHIHQTMPPEGAICDFCSSPDVHWSFPARDVVTEREFEAIVVTSKGADVQDVQIEHNSTGGWAACNVCAALIKHGDRDKLTLRSAKRQKRKLAEQGTFMSLASLVLMLRPLHDNFWASREGEPIHTNTRPKEDPTR